MTTFTWTRNSGSPGDWTTPANWDQGSGYPVSGDTVIITGTVDKCYINAASACSSLTVSSSQGDWSVAQQNSLTVYGDMTILSGTFKTDDNDLTIVDGKLEMKHEGQLDLSGSTLKVSSGSNATTYGLVVSDSGKILDGATGVWYVGRGMKQTSANAETYLTSGVCYLVGSNTDEDRYFELTAGKIYHNKGMIYIKVPDGAEGGDTTGWDNNQYVQWDGLNTTGNDGPWDLVIDMPWDARASPTDEQWTVRPRSKLIVCHYFYLYKGKFYCNYGGTGVDLTVSGMTWMVGKDHAMKSSWMGGNQPAEQNVDRKYSKYSRAILDCQGGNDVSLGAYPAKGNAGEYDKRTDGTNESSFQSVVMQGASSIVGQDSNLIIGSVKATYGDCTLTGGGTQYPYIEFSSDTTTFNSKGYNSYSSIYTNMGTHLGNHEDAFTENTIKVGFYHNSGTVLMQNGYSASIVQANQNDYKAVTIAGDPASGSAVTGYGRRFHWYNVHISGANGVQVNNPTYSGAPWHLHNEFKVATGSHIELRGGSTDIEPYAGGFFAERGVVSYISGSLDLRNYGAANYQDMLTTQSTTSSWTRNGAWPRFEFGSIVLGPSGKIYWPYSGNTKSLAQAAGDEFYEGAVIRNNGSTEHNNACFYMYNGGEMHHNSGSLMVSGVTWGEGIEHEHADGFTGDDAFYNLIISGGNCAPNRDISVIRDFTYNGVDTNYMTPQGAGTTDVWHIGRNLNIESGQFKNWYILSGTSNISIEVSGNLILGGANALLDINDMGTTNRYFKLHGNLINKGGKINSG